MTSYFDLQTIIWYIAFFAGLAFFILGIVYVLKKKSLREEHLIIASFIEFTGSVIMYIPEEFYNVIPRTYLPLQIIETAFSSLLRTFNIYLGNDYSRIEYAGHPVFTAFYEILLNLENIAILLFAAGFLIKFLEGPLQRLKLASKRKKKVYLFPCCNEKTISIAESIKSTNKSIVFLYDDEELNPDYKERIHEIGGTFLKDSVSGILRKLPRQTPKVSLFLFTSDEETNLELLNEVITETDKQKNKRWKEFRVYVELIKTPCNLYYDYLEDRKQSENNDFYINFVRPEENFVFNDLWENSIFENAPEEGSDGTRQIRFLLVGVNDRNIEMFKAVLHLSQMPGYKLTIMLIDDRNNYGKFMQMFPELFRSYNKVGDALYELIYKPDIDMESDAFDKLVTDEFPDFNFAFVNSGDDLRNLNLAIRLNSIRLRNNIKAPCTIQVSIRKGRISDSWKGVITENLQFVGNTESVYAYDFITMSKIEQGSKAIHEKRQESKKPGKRKDWIEYCNNEYDRHSVYARTLSFKHKIDILDKYYHSDYSVPANDRTWKIYEHMRWDVYTRAQGYILTGKALYDENGNLDKAYLDKKGNLDKGIRYQALVHNDLIDFDDLPKEEQDKDSVQLTDFIVSIIKSVN